MLETPVGTRRPVMGHAVLLPLVVDVEARLEVRLSYEGRSVPGGLVQVARYRRSVCGQGDAVGDHSVGPYVLAGDHRGACGHAHGVLVVCPVVDDAVCSERIYNRGACDRATGAAERVMALLVRGDEQDLSAHVSQPF